jgi:membrane dipeptidase
MNPLHQQSIIVDGLNASNFFKRGVLERLHQGGVTAVNATVAAWDNTQQTVLRLAGALRLFAQHSDLIMPVRSIADILGAKAASRVGILFGFQGAEPVEDKLDLLLLYHQLGVRIIQLTYNFENHVGYGCQEKEDKGLTPFGREVVKEMNRLGLLIDLSHCGPLTTLQGIETSEQPVAITHANSLSRCPHPRNKSDETLRLLAQRGGVVGAVSVPPFLSCSPKATLAHYLDMLEYLIELVGIDHVGVGPDLMEEMSPESSAGALKGLSPQTLAQYAAVEPVQGFESAAAFPNLTEGLLGRGLKPGEVQKVMGGNWVRLYGQVWGQ